MTDAIAPQPVVLGRITGAWGIRGDVRIHPYGDDPSGWKSMQGLWIADGDPPVSWSCVRIGGLRQQGEGVVVRLEGVADRSAAEALAGRLVGAPRNELPVPDAGEYYWGDLVGLEVVNEQGQSIGRVDRLIETGANDVLVVGAADGAERLLPFVAAVVLKVDVPAGRIDVAWGADW